MMADTVVLGSTGYIGSLIKYYLGFGCVSPSRDELLDFDFSRFSYVINCIGMVDQNACELAPMKCWRSNVEMQSFLLETLPRATKLIQISTTLAEYNGSWYSKCKAISDELITRDRKNFVIYRLPWLFGGEQGFDVQVKKALFSGDRMTIYDELGSPSYIKDVIDYIVNNYKTDTNTIDVANSGVRRKEGFALDIARYYGLTLNYDLKTRPYDALYTTVAYGELRPYEEALKEALDASGSVYTQA